MKQSRLRVCLFFISFLWQGANLDMSRICLLWLHVRAYVADAVDIQSFHKKFCTLELFLCTYRLMPKICDWAKMFKQTEIKTYIYEWLDCSFAKMIYSWGNHSYTFRTIPILIFSPVANFGQQSLLQQCAYCILDFLYQ